MTPLCPHREPFVIEGESFSAEEVIRGLTPLLLPERRARIAEVVVGRTYTVVPVMEGLYDRGNVSAVLRSAEALGYQGVHIIESSKKFKEARQVTQGAQKWLDIDVWAETTPCIARLRELGYRVLATSLEGAEPIEDFDFDTPTALVFGNEKDGVSEELLELADARVVVPMPGFSRSFNISVAAALCLYHIRHARETNGKHGDLDEETQRVLMASYYLRSVSNAEQVLLREKRGQ